jgi:hypothetical protein
MYPSNGDWQLIANIAPNFWTLGSYYAFISHEIMAKELMFVVTNLLAPVQGRDILRSI